MGHQPTGVRGIISSTPEEVLRKRCLASSSLGRELENPWEAQSFFQDTKRVGKRRSELSSFLQAGDLVHSQGVVGRAMLGIRVWVRRWKEWGDWMVNSPGKALGGSDWKKRPSHETLKRWPHFLGDGPPVDIRSLVNWNPFSKDSLLSSSLDWRQSGK